MVRGLLPRPAGNWGVLWGPEGQEEVGSHFQGRRCREGPGKGGRAKQTLAGGGGEWGAGDGCERRGWGEKGVSALCVPSSQLATVITP